VNLDVHQAAAEAKCHPDTLRKMAKAGEVPATKIGRAWVFPAHLLQQWIDERCHSTDAPGAPSGGSALAARLASQRAQRTEKPLKNSKRSFSNGSGGGTSSEIVVPFRGKRLSSDG